MKLRDLEKELRDAEARLVDKLLNANVDDSIVPDPAVLWQVCGGHAWYQGQVRVIDHAQQRPVAAKVEFRVDTDGTLDALVNNDVKLQGFVAGAHHGTKNVQTFPQQIPFSYLIGSIEEGGFNFVDINGREVGDVVPLRMVRSGRATEGAATVGGSRERWKGSTGRARKPTSSGPSARAGSGSSDSSVSYESLIPVDDDGILYRLPDAALIGRHVLRDIGVPQGTVANAMQRARRRDFLSYMTGPRGAGQRFIIYPSKEEVNIKNYEVPDTLFSGVDFVLEERLHDYAGEKADKLTSAFIPTVALEGKALVPKSYIDDLLADPVIPELPYVVEGIGLVQTLRDVVQVDSNFVMDQMQISKGAARESIKRSASEGVALYVGRSVMRSRKHFALVPFDSPELIRDELTFAESDRVDLEVIANSNVDAYARTQKSIAGDEELVVDDTWSFQLHGEQFFTKEYVDGLVAKIGAVGKKKRAVAKKPAAARASGSARPKAGGTSGRNASGPTYQPLEPVEGEDGVYRLPHTQFVTRTELIVSGLDPKQADNTMQRAGPKKGFLEYRAPKPRSPRFVLVPFGQESRLHADLEPLNARGYDAGTLWVDRDMLDTYLGGDGTNVSDVEFLPTIEHYGRTLVPKKYLDELVSGAERTKHRKKAKRAKEKKDTATAVPHPNAPPKRLQPTGTLVDVLHYFAHDAQGTMKQAEDGTRFYVALDGERWAPMVAEGDRITYGEVFKVFTPDDLHMKKRSDYQNGMRHAVMGTTAFTAKVTKDGEVPERTGRGIKLFLDGKYVNAARVYIIDKTDRTALSDMPTGVAI